MTGRNKFDLDFTEIHDVIFPGEVRDTHRMIARVRLRSLEQQEFVSLKVWRLSPLGVELVYPDSEHVFESGNQIDLEIQIAGQRVLFEGLVVGVIKHNQNIRLIGIRLSKRLERTALEERRESSRWLCSDEFFPTGVAASPSHINDHIFFKVKDLSPNGMLLVCSLRNKFLIPGMSLSVSLNFPLVGNCIANVKVARVGFTTSAGRDKLAVGVEYNRVTDDMKHVMGQYLIQFSNVESLDQLRTSGFIPKSVSRSVDFYFLKSESDYREVLELRRLAHAADGNLVEGTQGENMGDINDSQARIIVGRRNGRIVATARVRYNTPDGALEHETYVEWPSHLPRRDQILEVSRLCVHPSYRRGDLMISLCQFVVASSLQPSRPYVVIGCLERMIPFYSRIGLRRTGLSHHEPMYNAEQHIMIGNGEETVLGRGVSPLYWNYIWKPVADHMIKGGTLLPKGMDKIRISVYRALGPIAHSYFLLRGWFRIKQRG